MKKKLLLILRIVVALLGLAYIGYVLDWHDKVELPKSQYWPMPDGRQTDKRTLCRVLPGYAVDPVNQSTTLRVTDPKTVAPIDVQPNQLGNSEDKALLRPGILTTLRHADRWKILLGLLLVFPIYPIQAVRWRMLLRARGIDVTLARSFRLVMVGSFFNYCMPGSTGGDVVKAYYAAKRSDRRADAVMTVIFDRIVGLLGLVFLAGLIGLSLFAISAEGRPAGFAQSLHAARHVTAYIWLSIASVVFVSAIYFSRRLRKRTGLDWVLAKLFRTGGFLAKIDNAAVAYRDHKTAVVATIAMSVPLQLLLALSAAMAAFALHVEARWDMLVLFMTVVPVLFVVAAIPISYQGFGVTEALGFALLAKPGVATPNQVVVMLLLARLFQVAYSLIGSIFLLGGDIHMHPQPPADAKES